MEDNNVTDIESSDDEFYMNDECSDSDITDNEHSDTLYVNSSDSDCGSDLLPLKRRRIISLFSDEENNSDHTHEKIEENLFGIWYDVTRNDLPPHVIPFKSGTPSTGPQIPECIKEPIDFFKLFLTDELIEKIVSETNKYANSKIISSELSPNSTWRTWKSVDSDEITAFIGIILNMGLIPLPKMQDYWSQEFNLKIPFFTNIFRRQRFMQIFWMVHLNENVLNPTPRTRIQKINNFLVYIESKFQKYYIPGQNININKSVIKSTGKISFITYNKNKPTKWGIQIYLLADSSNGYVYAILPYYGSITTESLVRPDLPVNSRIVLHLYASLLNKLPNAEGYHIYCDRYYSSLPLADELLKLKSYFTGTINKNRKYLPKFIKKPKFTHLNKTVACRTNNIMLLAWQDKRTITTISTIHTSESCQTTRKFYDGQIKSITKPQVVESYIKHIRKVDVADQLASTYCFLRKSLKWWRKLFFWGIEVCAINAYNLYKTTMIKKNKLPMTHQKFVSILVNQLIGDFKQSSLVRGRPSSSDINERLNGISHYNIKSENDKKKDCLVCSKRNVKGGRRETRYFCETCTRKPGLHPGICFKRYHTMKDFKM